MNTRRHPRSRALRVSFATACGIAIAVLLQCQSAAEVQADRQHALDAWNTVYQVLQHPRCKNCHPSGDVPLQGDEGRLHLQGVQRGPDGKGLFAVRCDSCHQEHNLPGANLPPGAPNWHLPPKDMPMVFEGRSPAELARQIADPRRNGNKTPAEIFRHMAEDKLVLWGWAPGNGRTPVPVPHAEFAAAAKTWTSAGCPVPE